MTEITEGSVIGSGIASYGETSTVSIGKQMSMSKIYNKGGWEDREH